ncbi:putative photosynthesis system II assembly factor Ycf48/Hcf136-like domain-containing protein [Helianthus anomalus]
MVDFSCLCVVVVFISAKAQGYITEEFKEIPVQSRDFGILDVGYRSKEEAWAAGGSGVLPKTTNIGKSWSRDKAADNIAANLYSVR